MLFVDRASPLGRLERTPQGGYVAPAKIARTGILLYAAKAMRAKGLDVPAKFRDSDMVRVYMPAEVLQAAADSLRVAPVTNDHPPVMVDPTNYSRYAVGTVLSGSVAFDGKYLSASLALQDQQLILDVESGEKQEVSAGYMASTKFTAGVSPDGEAYDAVRDYLEYNHAAVVRRGRAGSAVRLELDCLEAKEFSDMLFTINGAEVDATSAQAAFDARDSELRGELDAANIQLEAVTSERDSLRADLDAARAELAVAKSQETLDAAVAAELTRRDAEQQAASRKAQVAAKYPKLDLSKYGQPAIDALYDVMVSEQVADPHGTARLDNREAAVDHAPAPVAAPKAKRMTPRERMLAELRNPSLPAVDGE